MPVHITLTVTTTSGPAETATYTISSNPTGDDERYFGHLVRKHGAALTEQVATKLDRLVDDPLSE
jgi:hypothetical protein